MPNAAGRARGVVAWGGGADPKEVIRSVVIAGAGEQLGVIVRPRVRAVVAEGTVLWIDRRTRVDRAVGVVATAAGAGVKDLYSQDPDHR